MMLQYGAILEIILIILLGLYLNLVCLNILNLMTMTGTSARHWIIVINNSLMFKSTSGPLWSCYYNAKLMCLIKKLCIILKQDCGIKLKFKFWFSSLQPWKLHAKFWLSWLYTAVDISVYMQSMHRQRQKPTQQPKCWKLYPSLVYSIPAMVVTIGPKGTRSYGIRQCCCEVLDF